MSVHSYIYAAAIILSNNIIPSPLSLFFKPLQRTSFVTGNKYTLAHYLPDSQYLPRPDIKVALGLSGAIECGYNAVINNHTDIVKCFNSVTLKTALHSACELGTVFVTVPFAPQICYAVSRGSAKVALDQYYTGKIHLQDTAFNIVKDLSARLVESQLVQKLGDPMGYYTGAVIEGAANVIIASYKSPHIYIEHNTTIADNITQDFLPGQCYISDIHPNG